MPLPTELTTGKIRFSFCHLTSPYLRADASPGEVAKYSTTILLPKSDSATKANLDRAYKAAIEDGIKSKWGGKRPPVIACPIYDGDGTRPNGEPFGEECKGHWVFTASSKRQPKVVDNRLQDIIDETEIYSGMYGKVSINFFPYLSNGKKGIGCGLNGAQKLADGEVLGGAVRRAEDMFSVVEAFDASVDDSIF